MKPNGRDYKTDPVLKRLVDLDHATLTFACRLQVRGPHTEGFQNVDVRDEDDGDNQGRTPDVGASQAEADDTGAVPARWADSGLQPTEEPREPTTTPALGGNVENVALIEPRPQEVEDDDEYSTIK